MTKGSMSKIQMSSKEKFLRKLLRVENPDYSMENFSRSLINVETAAMQMLCTITFLERKVIEVRYGLEDNSEHSVDETAIILGIDSEKVKRVETKAFRKLRHPTRMVRLGRNIKYLENEEKL